MDHKNLMFGDWVRSTVSGKAYQVLEAGDPFIMVDNPGGVWLRTIGMKHRIVEPIPLTAEILEKFGWKRKGRPYEWRDGIMVQKWNTDDGAFEILETPGYDGFTWRGCDINEVHKVQHALRVCGLNELAENFKVE